MISRLYICIFPLFCSIHLLSHSFHFSSLLLFLPVVSLLFFPFLLFLLFLLFISFFVFLSSWREIGCGLVLRCVVLLVAFLLSMQATQTPMLSSSSSTKLVANASPSDPLLSTHTPQRGRRVMIARFSIRRVMQRFVRSYRLQSRVALLFAVAYHCIHLLLVVIVVMSPLTVRSLLFRDEDNEFYSLTAGDEKGTRGVNVWMTDVFEFTRNGTWQQRPWFHANARYGTSVVNATSLGSFFVWEATPLSLVMYYYFYIIGSIFLAVLVTRGRINGYNSLLQLIFGGLEGLWYIRHNTSFFMLFLWLTQISSLFPYPWMPFAKQHPDGNITFHVFDRSETRRRLQVPAPQVELTSEKYIIPHLPTLEVYLACITVSLLAVLAGCFVLNFQRVLHAIVGVRELAVTDGHRRCPLCGEEWEMSTENTETHNNNNNNNNNNNDSNNTGGKGVDMLVGAAILTAMPLPTHIRPPSSSSLPSCRHRCRRLFSDGENASEMFSATVDASSDLDYFTKGDDDDDDDDDGGGGALPPTPPTGQRSKKTHKQMMNHSFVQSHSYGTLPPQITTTTNNNNDGGERRVPYDPFPDAEDEFRPGNAFPSLEGAGWAQRLTYGWLNPLMNFAAIDTEVLHHERFLPSLPDGFTSLQNIAAPARRLWVYRHVWFGNNNNNKNKEKIASDDVQRGSSNYHDNDDDEDDDSSDDGKTFVSINSHRPLTRSRLRPRRPKQSCEQIIFFFLTKPLRWLLSTLFSCIFINNQNDKEEGKAGGGGKDSTHAKQSRNSCAHSIGLFMPFLEHRCGRRFIFLCVPLYIVSDVCSLIVPVIIYYLIVLIEKDESSRPLLPPTDIVNNTNTHNNNTDNNPLFEGKYDMGAMATCMLLFFILLGRAVVYQEYKSQLYLSILEAQTAVKSLLLEKTLILPLAQYIYTRSEILHLLTIDGIRCSQILLYLHQIWRSPLFIISCLYMMYLFLGIVPTLISFLMILVMLPFQYKIIQEIHTIQQESIHRSMNRAELVGEAVSCMRQVKTMGIEDIYLQRIHHERLVETQDEVYIRAKITKSTFLTEAMNISLTYICFTSYYLMGGALTTRVVIPTLVILNLLRGVVAEGTQFLSSTPRGLTSLRRVEFYLQQTPDEFLGSWVDVTADWSQRRGTVICQGCSFTWQHDRTRGLPRVVLRNVRMYVQPGELVVVQGPVGAGKSTLLLAILGEVNRCSTTTTTTNNNNNNSSSMSGEGTDACCAHSERRNTHSMHSPENSSREACITSSSLMTQIQNGQFNDSEQTTDGFFVFGRTAYCSETPWLQNDTIRANIVLNNVYNSRWYQIVIRACGLHEDFNTFPKEDESVIGDKGLELSLGQRVRVSLARALYSRADAYILDNILAPQDSGLQTYLIERVFHGLLRNKTVILATYVGIPKLKPKRLFTIREDGTVQEEDKKEFTSIYAVECEEPTLPTDAEVHDDNNGNDGDGEEADIMDDTSSDNSNNGDNDTSFDNNNNNNNNNNNSKNHGLGYNHLKHESVYLRRFLSFMGPSLLWILLSSGAQYIFQVGKDVWLSLWIATQPISPLGFLFFYFLIGITAAMCTLSRMHLFFHAVRRSINHIHFVAIERIFRAPASYFDMNAVSTITGIFSRDQETVDHNVGTSLDGVITGMLQMLAIILFNAFVNPWFILVVPLMVMLFYHVVELYLTVAGEVRRLENRSARGPVAILREVLEGAPVIRCMGIHDIFCEEYCRALDVSNTVSVISHMADCWVNLRLELITVLMTTTAAVLGVMFASYIMPSPFAAVAVVCCLHTSRTLLLLCENASAFQVNFLGVEQLLELQQAPEEPLTLQPTTSVKMEADGGDDNNNATEEKNQVFNSLDILDVPKPLSREEQTKMMEVGMTNKGVKTMMTGTAAPVIEFVNVSAKYKASLPYALRNVNLVVYERERLGIIGRSGNGKSTIFNVLLRLVDVIEGGGVYVRGVDAALVPYPALRRRFTLILQDPLVVRGTWRLNLSLGAEGQLTDDEMWAALRAVGLDCVAAGHGGLDACLHCEGAGGRLSIGQRQLLWLARAVLQRPMFLLFDEIPGAGATETETAVRRVLSEELADCTVLLIAHRVHTLETLCTRVVVMDRGVLSQGFAMGGRTKACAAIQKKLESLVE